jgi:hypothetical protein
MHSTTEYSRIIMKEKKRNEKKERSKKNLPDTKDLNVYTNKWTKLKKLTSLCGAHVGSF